MKRTPENRLPSWPFWPEGAPYPKPPERLLKNSGKSSLDLFWEAYDEARKQGLPVLDVRYREMMRHWRRLRIIKERIQKPLYFLLRLIVEGHISVPYREGEVLLTEDSLGKQELAVLSDLVKLQGGDHIRSALFPALEVDFQKELSEHKRQKKPLEIRLLALPRKRAASGSGKLFTYGRRWPRWLQRPLVLTLNLKFPYESNDDGQIKESEKQRLRSELDVACGLRVLGHPISEITPLEKELAWELGVVAVARWHLVLGFDPPRDRPELLLSQEDLELRKNLLSKHRPTRQKALFELFQQAYQEENLTGLKKLPNLGWDRIIQKVLFRLHQLFLQPEDIGYRMDDFDVQDSSNVNRWQQWFLKRRQRSR